MSLNIGSLETRWESYSSPIARDLKLNFKKFALDSSLSPTEAAMVSLAVAKTVGSQTLEVWARDSLLGLGVGANEVLESEEAAALMGMLNSYYKFRGFISKSEPDVVASEYSQAGLRMTALARPSIGKESFELLALVVSVVNGCETCVTAHEKVLREAGMAPTKIHDAVRLAAAIKGLAVLDHSTK